MLPGLPRRAEHIGRERVSFDHLERQHLKGRLTWMTDQRHHTPKTVTLRLSAVKAFLAYASYEDLTLVALSQAAKALKAPAHPTAPIEYLSELQTRAALAAFTGQTAKSRRNRMLLILLYDTAARVGEITGLTLLGLCLTEPGHIRRIASLTQRAAERLSTSRSIASAAFSLRNRLSSSRSLSLNGPSPSRARRSRFTHRPSVPTCRPSSRATCAIGRPVSRTIRTAPSRNSRSKCRPNHRHHFLKP